MKIGDLVYRSYVSIREKIGTVGIIIKVYPLTQEVTVTWIDGSFPARCGIETVELISASR
jgi:hypothetical protein